MDAPASPIPSLTVVNLLPDGEEALQLFFDANPLYFLAVHGEPAQPGEAHEEISGEPPAGWPYTRKYVFGYQSSSGQLAATANVVSDLLAKGIVMGLRNNSIRVMAKPLHGQPLSDYYCLVERDRPASTSAVPCG